MSNLHFSSKKLGPLFLPPGTRDLVGNQTIPQDSWRDMDAVLAREFDRVFEVIQHGDTAIGRALELQKFLEVVDFISGNDLSCKLGKLLADFGWESKSRWECQSNRLDF